MARNPLWHKSLNDDDLDQTEVMTAYLERKLNSMSVQRLREIAKEDDIDLGSARTKAQIIQAFMNEIDLDDLDTDDLDAKLGV